MMTSYTFSFDLVDADNAVYSDIYVWVHSRGGYRFALLEDNTWGRLPSSCVVLSVNTDDPREAANLFAEFIETEFGYSVSHCMAVKGEPAVFSVAGVVPFYAKDRIHAKKLNWIRELKQKHK